MSVRFAVALCLAFCPTGVEPASSQSPPPVLPIGDDIRVRVPELAGGSFRGRFIGVEGPELLLQTATGTSRLPLAMVTELKRANGTRPRLLEGAVLGYLAGAVVGGVAAGGGSSYEEPGRQRAELLGGAIGAGAGLIIGSLSRTARWDRLSLKTVRPTPLPGTRVRVRLSTGEQLTGQIEPTAPAGLAIRSDAGSSVTLTTDDAQRLEWPTGAKRATLRGLAIGLGVGAIGGAVLGAVAASSCGPADFICFDSGEMALAAGVGFGAIGAMVGGTIGYFSRITIWEGGIGTEVGKSVAVRPVAGLGRIGFRFDASF